MSDTYIKLHTGKLNAVNIYAKFHRKKETRKKERKKLLCVGYYAIECINSRCIQLSSVIVCIYAKMWSEYSSVYEFKPSHGYTRTRAMTRRPHFDQEVHKRNIG